MGTRNKGKRKQKIQKKKEENNKSEDGFKERYKKMKEPDRIRESLSKRFLAGLGTRQKSLFTVTRDAAKNAEQASLPPPHALS